jgi:hypothetical protein
VVASQIKIVLCDDPRHVHKKAELVPAQYLPLASTGRCTGPDGSKRWLVDATSARPLK